MTFQDTFNVELRATTKTGRGWSRPFKIPSMLNFAQPRKLVTRGHARYLNHKGNHNLIALLAMSQENMNVIDLTLDDEEVFAVLPSEYDGWEYQPVEAQPQFEDQFDAPNPHLEALWNEILFQSLHPPVFLDFSGSCDPCR